jgi:hypothetical protein
MTGRIVLAILFAAALAGLAGCVSPEELRREDEAVCSSFGFQPGTTDFAGCLQRESLARRYGSAWSGAPPAGWYRGPGWFPPPRVMR